MRIIVQPIGVDSYTEPVKEACLTLNIIQTLWRFELCKALPKKGSVHLGMQRFALDVALNSVPSAKDLMGMENGIVIGAFAGRVDLDGRLSFYESESRKSVVSEFHWSDKSKVLIRATWILTLSNLALRYYTGRECEDRKCLGHLPHYTKDFETVLLNLCLCSQCRDKLNDLDPYRVEEIEQLVSWLKTNVTKNFEPRDWVTLSKPDLPILGRQITRQIKKQGADIFEDYGILLVMHFLDDLVPFIEGLLSLGAREESLCLLVKPYPYGNRIGVNGYFIHNHPKIRIIYLSSLPPDNVCVKQGIERCLHNSKKRKFLVIEDGGYVVPVLHEDYSSCENICLGAVEQTTKGIKRDNLIKDLRIPVINVAKSDFKDRFEAPLVGKAIVNSIQHILKPKGIHWPGKKAAVVGYGAIGKEVARTLDDLGMIVEVADQNLHALCEASIRGYKVGKAEDIVKDAALIVGTTGGTQKGDELVPTIAGEQLRNLSNGAILVSASSDQIEIDLEELKSMSIKSERDKRFGTLYTVSRAQVEESYLVVGDGYPINFFKGQGIPNQSIDPILTQLLLGSVYLTLMPKGSKGIIEGIADNLLSENKVIEDLFHVHRL